MNNLVGEMSQGAGGIWGNVVDYGKKEEETSPLGKFDTLFTGKCFFLYIFQDNTVSECKTLLKNYTPSKTTQNLDLQVYCNNF